MRKNYESGDIIIYEAIKGKPFVGIVTICDPDQDYFWARFWYVGGRCWEPNVDFAKTNKYITRIGPLPWWTETDEAYGSQLPPMS